MKMLEMPEYALYEIHESGKPFYMHSELDFINLIPITKLL